jgi:signal peptidase I
MNRAAGFRAFGIPSSSMEPTVIKGDRIMVDLRAYVGAPPHRGDPVVVRHEGLFIIKRVIATGGETIEGKNGVTFVNGKELTEPYAVHRMGANARDQLLNFGPVTVPPGKLFVMGDNRDVSYDSRMPEYGPIVVNDLSGKPLYVIRRANGDFAIPIR